MAQSQPPVLLRFLAGSLGGVLAGAVVFRMAAFDPRAPAFQTVIASILASAIIVLVRVGRTGSATALGIAFGLMQVGLAYRLGWSVAWPAALAGVLLGGGTVTVAWIYRLLAERGLRFGKFLIMGPLFGGLLAAVSPLLAWDSIGIANGVRTVLFYCFVGIVIGDGVGLGLELAELRIRPDHQPDTGYDPKGRVEKKEGPVDG